jgi:nicotinamide riboside kinase
VLQIAQGIIEYENDMLHLANHILFSDNDLINIKIWLQYYNWPVPAWLDSEIEKRKYDLYLLCNIDLPWIADEQRNNQHDRAELYGRFVELLNAIHANYIIVRGNESDRFNEATKAINNFST